MRENKIARLLPFMRPKGLVGIEVSSTTLKMAVFRPGPRREISSLSCREIKGLPDGEVVKSAADLSRELGAGGIPAALVIPSPMVISKNIEVPSVDSRELREIINLQAARHTPFSREEIIVDYIAIGTYKQNYTKILLLIVTNAAVKKQIALLEKAGIRVSRVLLCQEGIGAFVPKAVKTDASLPLGFVHVDDSTTDFSVVFRNRVLFIRSIPLGRQHLLSDREKSLPRFLEEVRKSLETYHAENIEKDPQSLYLSGCLEELGEIDLTLAAESKLPVKALDYWKFFQLSDSLRLTASKHPVSFLGVLAPLASAAECKVDLIPEEVRLKRLLHQRGMDLFTGGILLMSILVLMLFIAMGRIYFKSEYLKELETRYSSLSGEAGKVENVYQKNRLIRGYLQSRGLSVKVLSELHDLTPLNMELADIRFDRAGKLTLRGTSDSMSTVFTFVDLLEKSKYFKDVKTKYTTKRQEAKKDVTDFEINAAINMAAE